jgi:hypothetical protein
MFVMVVDTVFGDEDDGEKVQLARMEKQKTRNAARRWRFPEAFR